MTIYILAPASAVLVRIPPEGNTGNALYAIDTHIFTLLSDVCKHRCSMCQQTISENTLLAYKDPGDKHFCLACAAKTSKLEGPNVSG